MPMEAPPMEFIPGENEDDVTTVHAEGVGKPGRDLGVVDQGSSLKTPKMTWSLQILEMDAFYAVVWKRTRSKYLYIQRPRPASEHPYTLR